MNKLLVGSKIDLESGTYNLSFKSDSIININGNVTIYLNNERINNLEINLNNGSTLNLYKYDNDLDSNIKIIINQSNDTAIYYNSSFISSNNIDYEIINNIKGNNNLSNIRMRCISNKDLVHINVSVLVDSNTYSNTALEDLRGIINGGMIEIDPNIICSTHEVEANHLTTIGSVDNVSLDYLMSKGISKNNAKSMLLEGFIKSILGGEEL